MAEDLSYSDMVLNSQLETKMEQNTQIFRNLVSKHPYLKKKKSGEHCLSPFFIGVLEFRG